MSNQSLREAVQRALVHLNAGHSFYAIQELEAALAQPDDPPSFGKMLGILLARIHRDGGHYIDEHGWEKAFMDADAKVVQWLVRDDDKGQPVAWMPSREAINALPEAIRKYICDLETKCDLAGVVAENAILKDCNHGLQMMYRRSFSEGVEAAAKIADAHVGRPVAGEVLAHAIRYAAPQPPAEQGAELSYPTLPKPACPNIWGGAYSEEQVRQAQRDAVAADRAARGDSHGL